MKNSKIRKISKISGGVSNQNSITDVEQSVNPEIKESTLPSVNEPVAPLLSEEQFDDLENHLIYVERKGLGYKFKKGKHYYFDNQDNDNLLNYTMETGIYQGSEDYREPSFSNIKLLYVDKPDLPYYHDWDNYHPDKGVRPTAIFKFYEIDPKLVQQYASKFLTKGKIHGKETNSLLAQKISGYLRNG